VAGFRTQQRFDGAAFTRSEEFRTRWATRNVRIHGSGIKQFHHSVVGELELHYEEMDLSAEPGLSLVFFTAEPGPPSEERPRPLARWTATADFPVGAAATAPDRTQISDDT
jgi:hypothetical protein